MKTFKGKKPYGRKEYPSRGQLPHRDLIAEILIAPKCIMCGTTLLRKKGISGVDETMERFLKRKTCGFYRDKLGNLKETKCFKKIRIGEKNGNYKGLMPKCIDCGKRIAYLNKKDPEMKPPKISH